jgi:hypothetical protein
VVRTGFSHRPHVVNWKGPAGEGTFDPDYGFPIPGAPGEAIQLPCYYQRAPSKDFANTDNTSTFQNGKIFVDLGSVYPSIGTSVIVTKGLVQMFSGVVSDIYDGTMGIQLIV